MCTAARCEAAGGGGCTYLGFEFIARRSQRRLLNTECQSDLHFRKRTQINKGPRMRIMPQWVSGFERSQPGKGIMT